jgi:hypothetical protein
MSAEPTTTATAMLAWLFERMQYFKDLTDPERPGEEGILKLGRKQNRTKLRNESPSGDYYTPY